MYSGGGQISEKSNSQIKKKLWKMAKNKHSNLIARVKILNIGFINKFIINSGMGVEAIQY